MAAASASRARSSPAAASGRSLPAECPERPAGDDQHGEDGGEGPVAPGQHRTGRDHHRDRPDQIDEIPGHERAGTVDVVEQLGGPRPGPALGQHADGERPDLSGEFPAHVVRRQQHRGTGGQPGPQEQGQTRDRSPESSEDDLHDRQATDGAAIEHDRSYRVDDQGRGKRESGADRV